MEFFIILLSSAIIGLLYAVPLHLLDRQKKRDIEKLMSQGLTKTEAERIYSQSSKVISKNLQSHRANSISYLDSVNLRSKAEILQLSPEAILLYEQLTGKEMSYITSASIRSDVKVFHLPDTAVVLKKFGG